MNTQTGNIFDIDGQPLGKNEVELTAKQFRELFPIRDLNERLRRYQQDMRPTEFPQPDQPAES